MANQDFGTGKSLVVLAIVVGCFAILWPKIFYPMMQTAFAMTSPKVDTDNFRETDRPPHLHPGSVNPRLRNYVANDLEDKFHMREGRPFPHPQARTPAKSQPKSGGAMSIIMPIYTVGIMVFFLYTVLKLVFKKPQEAEKKPLIKDFHMDPQYRKFMCNSASSKTSDDNKSNKTHSKPCEPATTETEAPDLDSKDYEIYKLKKKLEETEEAMNRIMKHMGAMSECLSGMDSLPPSENSDVRLRHKGNSRGESRTENSKEMNDVDESEILNEAKRKMLQEDLAKAMLSVAQVSMKSCSEELCEKPLAEEKDKVDSDEEEAESEEMENSDEQSESSAEDVSADEQKISKSCYSNGCCKVSYDQPEKVL